MYKCVGKKKLNYLQKEGVRKKKKKKKNMKLNLVVFKVKEKIFLCTRWKRIGLLSCHSWSSSSRSSFFFFFCHSFFYWYFGLNFFKGSSTVILCLNYIFNVIRYYVIYSLCETYLICFSYIFFMW